ncbi:MAG TPA: DUF1549 and DUF1553 domain-containing protein [Pirellulales bacterium]|nr:DUF1549 and DUF1553 domain-containing protein [Pirellulales bacterium]
MNLRDRAIWRAALLGVVLLSGSVVSGEETCRRPASNGVVPAPECLTPEELAARIDAAFEAGWRAAGITPAPRADDAEFMRRVYLDITGKIPSVAEAQAFLDDATSDKRRRLVENLLSRGSFAAHFANVWRELLLPGTNTNNETRALAPAFEAWLKVRFAANVPYDALVSELLTARLSAAAAPQPVGRRTTLAPSPAAFFQVNENKPENLAASASRIFLGMQVQCAQCHDHPFSHWRRQQFWALAAFFGGVQPNMEQQGGEAVPVAATSAGPLSIKIPETDMVVEARFLDGSAPPFRAGEDARLTLSRWLTGRQNRLFAKAAVNRLLDLFYGHGFVEPVDDLDERHPPSHPELFEEIASQFACHHYDLKFLVRTIAATRAYQLSSRTDGELSESETPDVPAANPVEHFARMPLKRMTPEQLYDSLLEATASRDAAQPQSPNPNPFSDDSMRGQFLARFADDSARRSEAQTSILQALSLMNGSFTAGAASPDRSQLLSAVSELPYLDTPGRIETLYLATFSRRPTADELSRASAYVGQSSSEKEALADLFWALLNSAEFIFNH